MLSIRSIVKDYAGHRALNKVSIEIPQGSVFGLLGPNGAGKTSLIRIINQITATDSGEILFKGEKLSPKHIAKIGYLPEERGLYKKMEIGEQAVYLAQLKGLSRADALKRLKYWFEKFEMQSWWTKKVEELSKGMQQKVQFVTTVLHEPELLILDEPFSGFDPINAELIKDEFLALNRKGATIIFSTHHMESVEELCDSIALINKSEKILEGKVKDIKEQYRTNTFKVLYKGKLDTSALRPGSFKIVHQTQNEGLNEIRVNIASSYTPNDLLSILIGQVQVMGIHELIPGINELFIRKIKGEL